MWQFVPKTTDQEVRDFSAHEPFSVADVDSFLEKADQTTRKLISSITCSNTLNIYLVDDIKKAAAKVCIEVIVDDKKIVMLEVLANLKNLLCFLYDSLCEAALTGQKYITNSRRSV